MRVLLVRVCSRCDCGAKDSRFGRIHDATTASNTRSGQSIEGTGLLTSTHDGFEEDASRDENELAAARWTTFCRIERDQSSSS
jgi:hypothetical protein